MTSNTSPSTKRAAWTLPSRNFAARSGRAGVTRGSPIAVAQQPVDRPRGLALAAFGARGLCRWRPSENIDMQPAFGCFDETPEKQGAGDRTGKAADGALLILATFESSQLS